MFGAAIIEKHFTFDKDLPGNDHYHAMDKEDLKRFIKLLKRTFNLFGDFKGKRIHSEELSRINARRSLVASRKIPVRFF